MLDGSRKARLFSDNKSVCPKVCDDRDRLKCGTLQTRVSRMQQQAEAYVETEARTCVH